MSFRRTLALAVTLMTSACTTYRPEPILPAQTASQFDARSLDDSRLQTFIGAMRPGVAGRPRWDIDTLSFAALYYHPDLDLSFARLDAAQAAIVTARQRPNPSASLAPQFATNGAGPAWTVGLAVNLILELFGKRADRTREAQDLADAARADIGTAAWQVRGRVRAALLDLWSAQARVGMAQRRLAIEDRLVSLLERRRGLGEASALDTAREGTVRDQFALALTDGQRAAATARAQLATAIGIPASALDGVVLDTSVFDADAVAIGDTGALRQAALTGRADIRGALARYAAAQSALQLQIANQFPNLALGPGYTYDQGQNKFGLSLAADLPLFNQNQGPIAEAVARRKVEAATFIALQAQILGAIDSALVGYAQATRGLAAADTLLSAQRARQARTARLFGSGQIDRPNLLAGDLEVAAAEAARTDAAAAQRVALGALEDALQHPLLGTATLTIPSSSPRVGEEPNR
jgi:cobalt-zinc-cadmium efflux system outer membrane protein